ncbi:hypothetical protein KHP62_19620 [Rhodobacteraceae bacterium NNCM2]|nr:hypothetical protein [Coraliihabitans acroporae]
MSNSDSLRSFVELYPSYELDAHRLIEQDPQFRAICSDHATASKALRFWRSVSEPSDPRVADYEQLLAEFEFEILARLDRSRSSAT